jgi:general secretion pathway protein D
VKTIALSLVLVLAEAVALAQAPPGLPAPPTTNRTGLTAPPAVPSARPPANPLPHLPPPSPTRATNGIAPKSPASGSVPTTVRPTRPGLPAFPAPPAVAATNTPPAAEPALASVNPDAPVKNPDDMIPVIDLKDMPIEQFLDVYATYSGRTVLRSAAIAPLLKATVSLRIQTPMRRSELIVAMDTLLSLNNITMIPIGDRLVSAVGNATATTEGAAFVQGNVEDLAEGAQFVTKIVQLTNALPSEVAPDLQQFAKVPNGIVPFDTTKVLVLRDYAANVKRMMEVIKKIDRIPPTDYKFEVIPIRFSKVEDIYYSISSLISGGAGAPPPQQRQRTSAFGARPGQLGPSRLGQGGGYGNPYGQQGAYGQMTPMATPGTPIGGARSGANRTAFQNRLAQIVNRAAAGPGQVELLANAKIVPDENSNSLVVFANNRDLQMLTNIISKLDVALAQVLIEGIIMEVSLNDSSSLGVSLLQHPRQTGKFSGAGGVNNGQTFLNPGNFISGSNSVPVGISDLPSGFSYFGKYGNDFDVAVNAIAQDNTINVISRPRIQTSHAVPAEFFVGDTVPYVTASYNYGSLYGGVPTQSSYNFMNVGVDLSVTPYITPDGVVTMDIDENISQLGTPVTIDGNPVPTTSTRMATATISVRDRDTIILGGFISSTKSKSKAGVPILKDIPLLGALFRSKNDTSKRTELIALIRPTVLPNPEDAAATASAEKNRLYGIRAAEKEFQKEDQQREKHEKAFLSHP